MGICVRGAQRDDVVAGLGSWSSWSSWRCRCKEKGLAEGFGRELSVKKRMGSIEALIEPLLRGMKLMGDKQLYCSMVYMLRTPEPTRISVSLLLSTSLYLAIHFISDVFTD